MFAFFERLIDPFQPYDDTQPIPNKIGAFYRMFLRPARQIIIWTMLMGVVVGALEILMLDYLAQLIDMLETTDPAAFWATHRADILIMTAVVVLIRPIVYALDVLMLNQGYLSPMAALVRWRAHRHVLRQSVSFFHNDFAGRIAQKVIQTGPAVADTYYGFSDSIWYSMTYVVGALILLGAADPRLFAIFAMWLALYVLVAWWIVPRIGQAAKEMSEARSQLTGRIVDSYTNIQTVKLFAHADHEDAYAQEGIQNTLTTFQRQMRIFTIMDLALLVLNTVLIIGVVGAGVWLWTHGEITTGAVAAASALVLRLNAMTGWIMWTLSNLFSNIGVAMEGMETISRPRTVLDAPNAAPLPPVKGGVTFENTTFMYGRDKGGLGGIDLSIRPGERIGLVGRSGAGKSTLVNALLRFYDLEDGRILIDGADAAQATQESLRQEIAVVTQDTALLHRSVRDNLRYGRPDATEEQIIAAAHQARAHDFILDLEDPKGRTGYDAHVGERGVKLSGGQRQRISIARALLKDAPILVLDEATSALDSEVEAEIQEQLYSLMAGKTVIAIAHRLSTVAQMDRIVVMDAGRIAEQGTHGELLAAGGLYAGFWSRQSGGFLGKG